jgi:hypothetical protein
MADSGALSMADSGALSMADSGALSMADSGALLDASLDVDAASDGDGESISDVWTDTNEPDVRDAEAEEAGEACPPATMASDFHVVPAGDPGACNTFSTISAALQAARASSAAQRTVHLAPGTYSDAAEFPIDLRGGISLAGSGEGSSIMTGVGATTIAPPTNAYARLSATYVVYAAILAGDPEKSSQISGVTLELPPNQLAGTEAIVCDRGNAATSPPSPDTLVSHVDIHGFEVGVRVTWSGPPLSGCNLALTSSTIHDGWFGVVADGDDSASGPVQPVSVRLGDLMGGGNSFSNLDVPSSSPLAPNGAGLATCDAVTGVVVEGNHFFEQPGALSDLGIWAVHAGPYESPGFHIERNDFGPLTTGGIWLWGPVVIDELLDNSIHDNSMVAGFHFEAVGLSLSGDPLANNNYEPFAVVRRARGNTFFGNDLGLTIHSYYTLFAQMPGLETDFGTAADPGNNTFRCNAVPASANDGPGSDVFIAAAPDPTVTIPFEGNVWDHAPATTVVGPYNAAPPGTDVSLVGSSGVPDGPLLDTADASTASTPPCPPGRVAGP